MSCEKWNTMPDEQKADSFLRLLDPNHLPVERESLARAAIRLVGDHRDDQVLRVTEPERHRARRVLTDELLGHEPIPPARSGRRALDQDEHDRHFGVVRVHGDSGAIFLTSLLVSYLDMLDDVERGGTTLGQAQWTDLLRVPTLVFDFALRRQASAFPGSDFRAPPLLHADPDHDAGGDQFVPGRPSGR